MSAHIVKEQQQKLKQHGMSDRTVKQQQLK